MKSLVAVVLSCLMLWSSILPGFGVDQSAQWGNLVQHYLEHRKADKSLDFMDFLAMHYAAGSEHQKHPKHSHHNLPSGGSSISVYTPAVVQLDWPSPFQVALLSTGNAVRKDDLYSFLAVFALINPPRA
jgi:hypothetical protein